MILDHTHLPEEKKEKKKEEEERGIFRRVPPLAVKGISYQFVTAFGFK